MWDPGHALGCHWRRGVAQRECACKQAASGEASGTKRLACGDAFQILQIGAGSPDVDTFNASNVSCWRARVPPVPPSYCPNATQPPPGKSDVFGPCGGQVMAVD